MQFGLLFFSSGEGGPEKDKYGLLIEAARYADRNGFSSLWVPERHFSSFGCLFPNPAVVLAGLARETTQIHLRAASVALPLHDTIRVAEEWSVLDNLSGGRVGFACASGWHPNDFVFFPDRYEQRHAFMDEAIATLDRLWRGETISKIGGDGKRLDVRTYPTPVQPRLPIWVAAAGRAETFVKAGRLGANVITHLLLHDIDELAEKIALYRRARAESGFDPATGVVTLWVYAFVGADDAAAKEAASAALVEYFKTDAAQIFSGLAFHHKSQKIDIGTLSPDELHEYMLFVVRRLTSRGLTLFGSPEGCRATVQALADAGVDELGCQLDFGPDLATIEANLPHLGALKDAFPTPRTPATEQPLRIEVLAAPSDGKPAPANGKPAPNGKPAAAPASGAALIEAIKLRCTERVDADEFYRQFRGWGFQYGPLFRNVEAIWRRDGESLGRIAVPAALGSLDAFAGHPNVLDSCLQVLSGALPYEIAAGRGDFLVASIGTFRQHRPFAPRMWSHARLLGESLLSADTLEGDIDVFDDDGVRVAELRGFTVRYLNQADYDESRPLTEKSLYRLAWTPAEALPAPTAPAASTGAAGTDTAITGAGCDLVFADAAGVGDALVAAQARRGRRCVVVRRGGAYAVRADDDVLVDPAAPDDLRRALAHAAAVAGTVDRIVFLWPLQPAGAVDDDDAATRALLEDACRPLLSLVQAVAASGLPHLPPLVLVTAATQPVRAAADVRAPQAAPVWGMGRTIGLEFPETRCKLVDLAGTSAADAAPLAAELAADDGEREVAYRDGARFIARLERVAGDARPDDALAPGATLRADATYVVTGGLGALGLEIASWLGDRGARHVLLLGRRAPSDAAQRRIDELERAGVRVTVAHADVAERAELARALATARLPIRGIVHAAGVLDDGVMVQQTWERFAAVLRPKIFGALNLHALTAGTELDFFVTFSSIASLLGSAGQSNYAAANAFMDALAHRRHAAGLPGLSVNWGPFAEGGMAAALAEHDQHRLAERGIRSIAPRAGLKTLKSLLASDEPQIGVLPVDWRAFFAFFGSIGPIPHVFDTIRDDAETGSAALAREGVLQKLAGRDAAEQTRIVEEYVERVGRHILRLGDASLELDQPLNALGLDSLMSIEFKNVLKGELDVDLPVVKLLEGISITEIATYVCANLATAALEQSAPSSLDHLMADELEEGVV